MQRDERPADGQLKESFPGPFWSANVVELFERAAYYSMASFVVIYLGQLGLGKYWPSNINGILWTLVYFLPILSGTIADQVGFKRALLAACAILAGGYFFMGFPVWFGGNELLDAKDVAEPLLFQWDVVAPIIAGILLIGVGGSIIKPCISGTVQKTAGQRATLAFAIFYMVINIGSLVGRGVAYVVRTNFNLSFIFMVAMAAAIVAGLIVLFWYKDPDSVMGVTAKKPKKSIGRILADMVLVLKNGRFALFLVVTSGFNFLYNQVYNVIPLYTKNVLERDPPMDIYTMANPFTIVFFQLLITKLFGRMKPIKSIVIGTVIIAGSMAVNIVPVLLGNPRADFMDLLPIGSLMVVMTVSLVAFGELFSSARTFEYIGALAPKGQEGLFLGYANLPMAIGALVGGPVGAYIFNDVMCRGAVKRPDGLLDLDPTANIQGWLILMGFGLASAAGLWTYNRWIQKNPG